MLSEVHRKTIVESILQQASAFLQDAGAFFPFGTAIGQQGEIRPVGLDMGEENPKSDEMLQILSEAFVERIQQKQYKCAAIAVDVALTIDGEKMDAVEIHLFETDSPVEKTYFKYHQTGDAYAFAQVEV